jgi:hypothetical protein
MRRVQGEWEERPDRVPVRYLVEGLAEELADLGLL